GLVLSHLVNGVMDSVQVQLLGQSSQLHLAVAGAVLSVHTHLQVGLGGIGQNLAQQLGELGSMLGLLEGVALPGLGDLGVTLAVSPAAHGQVHTSLGALAVEVLAQALDDLGRSVLSDADHMLGGVAAALYISLELVSGSLALGAGGGSGLAFVHITTNFA